MPRTGGAGDSKYRSKYDRNWIPPYNSDVGVEVAFVLDKEAVKQRIVEMDEELTDLIITMRQTIGAALVTSLLSWADVGSALGVARQSAYERFQGARKEMAYGDPEALRQMLQEIGAKQADVTYEVRTTQGNVVQTATNPAELRLDSADLVVVKVYPDGTERIVRQDAVEDFARKERRREQDRQAAAEAKARGDFDDF